jgi:hypothetical protein
MRIDILHIDANYDTKYNMEDINDKGVQWLHQINKYIKGCRNAVTKPDSEHKSSLLDYVESVVFQLNQI